jgi:hypothetical protein
MNSNLLSRGSLEIPEALTLDHEKLRSELTKAAAKPGEIGNLAECAAQLYLAHFVEEEQCVSRAFGMLHDLASDRSQPNSAEVAWMIAQYTDQHLASRDHTNRSMPRSRNCCA